MDQLYNLLYADKAASTAYTALTEAGGTVYIVGGAIRDVTLGVTPKDIDLMVTGLAVDQIESTLQTLGVLKYTGKQFGVFRFKVGQDEVEIAMPRTEVSTGPRHTDFSISTDPNLTPEEDLERRDFTGNAMAFNPQTGITLDPYGGKVDLQNKRLRLVNQNAFRDDPLRIVRAIASTARFGLEPDNNLIQAMQENASQIRHLPGERIQEQMDKLFSGSDPARAFEIAFDSGLIDYLAPELSAMQGFSQYNPHHDLTVDQHTLAVLRAISQLTNDPDLRLAALFHDSGKPESFWQDPDAPDGGGGHFYKKVNNDGTTVGQNHEDVGADLVTAFMERLRYPKKRIERVRALVQYHMFPYFNSEKGARRFLQSVGGDAKMAWDLLTVRQADASGKRDGQMNDFDTSSIATSTEMLQRVLDAQQAITVKDLALNGHDLINLGIPAGPEIGQIQRMMLDIVVDNPNLNTREGLLGILQDALPRQVKGKVAKPIKWPWSESDPPSEQAKQPVMSFQPWWKWSYDGKDLTIWRVNPKTGRPHHIEVTGNGFYKLAQGRVYVEWGLGTYLGGRYKDYIEILVWKDRGTEQLQTAAIDEVEKYLYGKLGRPADIVTYDSEGINWMDMGQSPTTQDVNKFYWGIKDEDDKTPTVPKKTPSEQADYDSIFTDDSDEYDPKQDKSLHDMTDSEWEKTQWDYLNDIE